MRDIKTISVYVLILLLFLSRAKLRFEKARLKEILDKKSNDLEVCRAELTLAVNYVNDINSGKSRAEAWEKLQLELNFLHVITPDS